MIDGVKTKKLRVIPDERGRLMEILRKDDEIFEKFGQVYMSATYPAVVKGWHMHQKQADNICCVHGMLKLVVFDGRDGSPTKGQINEFFIGEHNPMVVHIPARLQHGWMCISDNEALVINIPTETYEYAHPDEQRLPAQTPEIPYDWRRKDG
jgi:dTDP-4-dehydrorhamnose 3,5-epimerase